MLSPGTQPADFCTDRCINPAITRRSPSHGRSRAYLHVALSPPALPVLPFRRVPPPSADTSAAAPGLLTRGHDSPITIIGPENEESVDVTPNSLPLDIAPEVAAALGANRPVVALESTIISHGLPWPDNLAIAREIEAEVREQGAVPATIAVLDGRIRIGLDDASLTRLARAPEGSVAKLSRADIAPALACGRNGATTVAATMILARLAGIDVFATGGIGGVHRGAETNFDISADLVELGRTGVTVVAAGAKAILDLPKTLEVLETEGVAVIGWRTDAFPAFWCRESGLEVPIRMDEAREIARAHLYRQALGVGGGQLVANPIPEAAALPRETVEDWIASAAAEARRRGITGKAVTPFLLGRIAALSGGRSLEANRALVRNNARLAAEIAAAICIERQSGIAAAGDAP